MQNRRSDLHFEFLFRLAKEGCFDTQSMLEQFDASLTSFHRAISDFRCYLAEHRPEYELVFDRERKCYVLEPALCQPEGQLPLKND